MSTLLDKIIKNSTSKNTAVIVQSKLFKDKDVIQTEIPVINLAFSGNFEGGLSNGLTLIAGKSRTFKSLLSLVCVKSFLDKYEDSVCILYDSEGGITPQYLSTNEIDVNRVIHIPIEHIEMLKFDIVNQLKDLTRDDKVIIVIDSIGNLASLKELEDALNEKTVAEMTRAKSIKGLFRMITPSLIAKDIPCITVCHTYDEMSLWPKQIISGGCLLGGTKIRMSDGTFKEVQNFSVGDKVSTLDGTKIVTEIWNPDTLYDGTPECYEIEFEDGYKVVCSADHKFLIGEEWIETKFLKGGEIATTSS